MTLSDHEIKTLFSYSPLEYLLFLFLENKNTEGQSFLRPPSAITPHVNIKNVLKCRFIQNVRRTFTTEQVWAAAQGSLKNDYTSSLLQRKGVWVFF